MNSVSPFSELSKQWSWGPLVSEGRMVLGTVPLTLKVAYPKLDFPPCAKYTLKIHCQSTSCWPPTPGIQEGGPGRGPSRPFLEASLQKNRSLPLGSSYRSPHFPVLMPTSRHTSDPQRYGPSLGCDLLLLPSHMPREERERFQEPADHVRSISSDPIGHSSSGTHRF